jgi:hypothetical protein
MPGPQLAELGTPQRQLAGKLDESRIVDVGAHRLPQARDEAVSHLGPVGIQRLFGRLEEDVTHLVAADGQTRRQGPGTGVRGQDVEVPSLDERRLLERGQQLRHPRRNRLLR